MLETFDVMSKDENNFLNACLYGKICIIKKIIDKVNINVQDKEEGYTPLMNAIIARSIEAVKILLEHKADVTEIKDKRGRNAFFLAASLNELEILKLFEKYNPDFNTVDNDGSTILFYTRKKETIDYLLKNGTDINKKNKYGMTILIENSLYYENQNFIKFLVVKGADINAQNNEGLTTLMLAVKNDRTEIIDLCLSAKADPNIKDNEGKTALFYTISSISNLENVKLMTENIPIYRIDQKKIKATNAADRLIKLLVYNGADINAQDNRGNTLLMYAMILCNEPIIDRILKLNPNLNIKNKEGKTAKDMAKNYIYKFRRFMY